MKFSKLSLFLALLIAACVPVVAQEPLRLNIPFDFTVGRKSFPAGEYRVESASTTGVAWRIYNDRGSAMILTDGIESPAAAHHLSLIFLRAGEGYTLDQIWPSEHSGREVLRPSVKQTLVAQGAKNVEIGAE